MSWSRTSGGTRLKRLPMRWIDSVRIWLIFTQDLFETSRH
jgi:hypothetical protein